MAYWWDEPKFCIHGFCFHNHQPWTQQRTKCPEEHEQGHHYLLGRMIYTPEILPQKVAVRAIR